MKSMRIPLGTGGFVSVYIGPNGTIRIAVTNLDGQGTAEFLTMVEASQLIAAMQGDDVRLTDEQVRRLGVVS